MGLEDLTGNKYIDSLNTSNPDGSGDEVSTADDHLRGIKNVLKKTFPNVDGPINLTPDEANVLDGIDTSITTDDLEKTMRFEITADGNLWSYGQTVVAKTANFTLALSDLGYNLDCNKSSAFVLTVPNNTSVALPTGFSVTIVQSGSGTVTVTPAAGVTIQSVDSNTSLRKQWSAATLYKRSTNEWVLVGDLK